MIVKPEILERAEKYAALLTPAMSIIDCLGGGTDGTVLKTDHNTALKIFEYERGYYNERDTYLRLADFGITDKIDEFWVPQMVGYDDELMVVEMDIVEQPPYILDFAKVKLNNSPEFSDEILADLDKIIDERFEHHAKQVRSLMRTLESFLIFYLDPQPGNIVFHDIR